MSAVRAGRCAEPGPYESHCTLDRMHDYSCYDASEDVSFNHRQDFEHHCTDSHCPRQNFINEGD